VSQKIAIFSTSKKFGPPAKKNVGSTAKENSPFLPTENDVAQATGRPATELPKGGYGS